MALSQPMRTEPSTASAQNGRDPIAIVGVGCRLPGDVNDPESLWELLSQGRSAVGEIPGDRFSVEALYDSRPATPGKIMTRWGGFVKDVDRFDAFFFGIAPHEAERLDPQQRLLLETSWEALADAGQDLAALAGSRNGVFVGQWLSDYEARLFADPSQTDFYMTTGSGRYSASGRLSYQYGWQGPSLTIDTACSSSLVAVHLAVQSLRNGECGLAIAAGSNVILQPHITIAYSQSKMMAPDGRCKFGDAAADGYVRSDGAVAIVLKRLSDALKDGDPIRAVILGTAVNNDGRSSGTLTTPSLIGQEEMLRLAYADAGVAPTDVSYIEAHGTGTRAGDPVEIGAIGAVLGAGRPSDRPLRIGSIKSNIGHTEGAAGLAGLLKVVLSLQKSRLPASLHVQTPNPNIAWADLGVTLQRELEPWPTERARIAGVSAFGIAGTNAHVVLAAAPNQPSMPSDDGARAELVAISAQTPEGLFAVAESVEAWLGRSAVDPALRLRDLAHTAGARRSHLDYRAAFVADTVEGLRAALADWARDSRGGSTTTAMGRARRIAFVFPGQGGQWLGMGRQLLEEEAVFRAAIERCEAALKPHVRWSLIEQLTADDASSRLEEIDVVQPMLFAVQVGLAELWRSWGVTPEAVVGHSMGEVAAACVAGALSLEDAACVICSRSRLMKQVSGQGAMALVGLPLDEAQAALAGYEDRLSIAVSNGPRSTVLSGDPAALAEVVAALERREVFCRAVNVDVAAHSPHMDALREPLVNELAGVRPSDASAPIYSTVTGTVVAGGALDAEYWGRNLREPVLFATAVQELLAAGFDTFIEINPHPILLQAVVQADPGDRDLQALASLRRDAPERATLLESLGTLYALGQTIDWRALYPDGRCLSLPSYPWQRERFWYDGPPAVERATPRAGLLDGPMRSAAQPQTRLWEGTLSVERFPFLSDHRVRQAVVLPAAAMIDMALTAAGSGHTRDGRSLQDVRILEAVLLHEPRAVQVVVGPAQPGLDGPAGSDSVKIFSRAEGSDDWTLHATGVLGAAPSLQVQASGVPLDEIRRRAITRRSGVDHIASMDARGLNYGDAFTGIRDLWHGDGESLADIALPVSAPVDGFQVPPALLDACFQTLLDTTALHPHDPYVPMAIKSVRMHRPLTSAAWAHAVRSAEGDELVGDLFIYTAGGDLALEIRGLRLTRLSAPDDRGLEGLFYETSWQEVPLDDSTTALSVRWVIINAARELGPALQIELARLGATAKVLNPGELDEIATAEGVISLWAPDGDPAEQARSAAGDLLASVQRLTAAQVDAQPRLWLATCGAMAVMPGEVPSPAMTALWGLGGVVAHEHPGLGATRVDLAGETSAMARALAQELTRNVQPAHREDRVAWRNGKRFVARLQPAGTLGTTRAAGPSREDATPFRIALTRPGVFDNLIAREQPRRGPGAGQIEIAVEAAGLNFINVLSALGIYPGVADGVGPLGLECAGVVTAVGDDVTGFAIGDAVLAISHESLGSHALADARLVARWPKALSALEAATVPIVFVTALYGLERLAQLQPGERVLIHSATGGVGLAAIQLARLAGAEVFATAGSAEKRAYLEGLGVQHVYDSRSVTFAEAIQADTGGAGVDVVLNSLAGAAIPAGLSTLAPYGRFVELGKRDVYDNTAVGLWPFRNNLAYFMVDLERMCRERPAQVGALLREVVTRIEEGRLSPLPTQAFPAAEAGAAFRHMAQARHIGKIAITVRDAQGHWPPIVAGTALHADAAYLITGGLGALGLAVADWMVDRGARHLALMGRHEPEPEARAAIDALRDRGTHVITMRGDVAQASDLRTALDQIGGELPPLRGVIHAAGILDDGILSEQTRERFDNVLRPKVDGAWNLHQLTRALPIDFMVYFSSVASLLGTPGQGNYAAANGFLDGLAAHRRAQGLAALSLNWGPWSSIGLAVQGDRNNRLAAQGIQALTPDQGLAALEAAWTADHAQLAIVGLDAALWRSAHPADEPWIGALLPAETRSAASSAPARADRSVRDLLASLPAGRKRREGLEAFVREQTALVLRLPPARIDVRKPLRTLGFDSLMTLELRNRLEAGLRLSLPATLVWNYPTIADLVPHLAERMGLELEAAERPETPASATPELTASREVDAVGDDEVGALLEAELNAIDELLRGQ